MNIKRLIGSVAVAGIVGASTLGIGDGIANASTDQPNSGTPVVQTVDWRGGHGYGHGFGRGFGRGWGHGYGHWGGWPGFRWHPWGWRGW
jgi:hypothetical protein